MKILLTAIICFCISICLYAQTAVIVAPFNGDDLLTQSVKAAVEKAGYKCDVSDIGILEKGIDLKYDLTVFCDARYLPADSTVNFWHYLNNKRSVIALNAPGWVYPLVKVNDKWINREDYLKSIAFTVPNKIIYDFNTGSESDWIRDTYETKNKVVRKYEFDKERNTKYLNFYTELRGKEYLEIDKLNAPFSDDNDVTMFTAKGDDKTSSLAVIWVEKDKSKWISVVPLDEKDWKLYMLEAKDFKYNGGNDSRRDSAFNPKNANGIIIGLEQGVTDRVFKEQSYSIANLGTSKSDSNIKGIYGPAFAKTEYYSFSPDHSFFEMHGVNSLEMMDSDKNISIPKNMLSSHQRPQASGYDKKREFRWIPITEALTNDGKWRGNPIAMVINFDGIQSNAQYTAFAINDGDWYKENSEIITDAAKRMKRGLYFIDAGADYYTYQKGQPIRIGANVANIGRDNADAILNIVVKDNKNQKVIYSKSQNIDLDSEKRFNFEDKLDIRDWTDKGYNISCQLVSNGIVIDSLHHDIYQWIPKANPNFVKIKDGKFYRNGKEIKFHGLNYHPTSTSTSRDWNLFLEWFGKRSYDPEVIERDLTNIVNLGFNALSVQIFSAYPNEPQYANVIDFLRRAENHGLLINFAMNSNVMSDSFDKRYEQWSKVVAELQLDKHDVIFAYDIDWEPTWLDPGYRKQWDKDWEAWIIDRYGSVENAETDWKCKITRDENGNITNPPVEIAQKDSENRNESLAYRRFLDYWGYKKYSYATDRFKDIDKNHYVSFRMHAAGDVCDWYGLLPYGFNYMGKAVDIFSPEAYASGTSWDDHFKTGLFTRAIAKWANPNNPMMYAEVGYNSIEGSYFFPTERGLNNQASYFRDFYRLLIEGGANGIFWWWYQGGFRVLENSDYGIVNPDDSDKPVTDVIRALGQKFLAAPSFKPDTYITVDPSKAVDYTDATALYNQVQDKYWELTNKGKTVGLITPGTGTTSANCPLISVTNTLYNGSNPLKYLDGAFERVTVSDGNNKYIVKNGDVITVKKGVKLNIDVYICNLNEAMWIGNSKNTGSVVIDINDKFIALPKDIKYCEKLAIENIFFDKIQQDTDFNLGFNSIGRAKFGETFRFSVKIN